jgi:uncharacterized membrane protein
MALLVALPLINSRLAEGLWRPVPRLAWAMAALVLVVPMAQLVPLPPALWQSLPGRAAEMQSLALIGGDRGWMPWSIAPARTFISLVAMVCPVLALLLFARVGAAHRLWLVVALVMTGFVSIVVGLLQIGHVGGFAGRSIPITTKAFWMASRPITMPRPMCCPR